MKPVLYPKTETTYVDFGFGEISDALSVEVTRERNGDYSLYMKYPHDGIFADKLQKEMQLKADAGPRTKWQTFDVVRINKKSTDYIEVYAKHISFRLSGAVLKNAVTLTDVDARTALAQWKNNLVSDTVFDIDSDITTTGSVAWAIDKVTNAREALGGFSGSILDVYGGEYEFDNQLVKLHKQMGRKAPIVLEYGRNIQEIEVDDDDSEVYNSILPFAKITQQEDEKSIEVLTTLPEIYIDGPFIGDYQRRIIKQVDFSTKFDSEKNKPTVEKLRSLAMSYVKSNEVGKPKTTIDVKYVDLASTLDYADMQVMEEVELCDILPLYYPKFGITSANEKVVKTVYDVYNDEYISLTLGTIGQTLRSQLSESTSGRIEALENKQKQFETELPTYLTNASGNRNWYDTPDDTQEHKIGDIWFEKNGQYERMYVWDGNQWILKIDTEDPDRIKRTIDQQFEDFNTSYDEAKALQDQQIADVLAKAGTAEDLANQAKTDAASAIQRSSQLKEEAVAEADRLVQAQSTALTERIQSVDVRVDDVANQVSSKVSQIDFDAVKKTVESNSTEITQNQSAIELKADKTVTDELATTVNQTKSELKITSDAVATKVSKTDFDATNQRLTTAETTIRAQAGQIEQRLTSTQVESAINAKGYQTKAQVDNNITGRGYITNSALQPYALSTTVQNLVQETADSFSRTISETKALIPTEIGNRNLALATSSEWSNNHTNFSSDGSAVNISLAKVLTDGLKVGDTLQVYVFVQADLTGSSIRLRLQGSGDVTGLSEGRFPTSVWIDYPIPGGYAFAYSVKVISDHLRNKYWNLALRVENATGGWLRWREIKVSSGPVRSDWSPAFEDLATVTALHSVRDTVDSHTRIIGDIEGNVSQVTQTAQGLVSRVGSLIDNQNLVYDPTNYSKYTQREPNSNITRMIMPGYKLIKITQSGLTANAWRGFKMPLHSQRFTQGEKLSYRVALFVDVVPDDILGFEIKNGVDIIGNFAFQPTQTGGNQIFTGTFTIAKTTLTTDDYALHVWLRRNGQVNIGQISIVRGDVPPTTFVDSTSAMQLATETQVSQLAGSWAVKNLTSSGAVLNQINLLADGTNRIDGRLTHITGSTLIDNGVIKSAMIGNAQINTAHIGTIDAGQANIININASNITSGTITGINMRGGVLTSLNGAVNFDLQSGHLNFLTSEATMRRQLAGYPTQFIKFDTGSNNGTVTVIGSNRDGSENPNNGDFAGIRIWNDTTSDGFYDYIDVAGDIINFTHKAVDGGSNTRRGWEMKSYGIGSDVSLRPIGYFNNAHITATEYRILNKNTNSYKSLSQVLDIIFDNFRNISEKGGFNRSYYSNWR